jgi:hypothetical protein
MAEAAPTSLHKGYATWSAEINLSATMPADSAITVHRGAAMSTVMITEKLCFFLVFTLFSSRLYEANVPFHLLICFVLLSKSISLIWFLSATVHRPARDSTFAHGYVP